MARINVNPALPESKLLLDTIDQIQTVRAALARTNNIMDYTRSGADFSPLATALGCSAAEAEAVYSQMKSIEATMNGGDFVNLSQLDQG